ncbi:MAG TPA: fimbria/pilus outer membrane usher protein [Solimonas sp.]
MGSASFKPGRHRPWSALLASGALLASAALANPASDLAALNQSVNLALLQGPGTADSAQDLYLEVFLNDVPTRRIMHVAQTADGRLLAWPEHLAIIGLRLDGLATDRYLDLATLPDVDAHYDSLNQRLEFNAKGSRLNLRRQTLNTRLTPHWPATRSPGLLLNYDLYGQIADDSESLAAATELRAFGPYGVFDTTGLSRFGGGDSAAYIRLDTAWTWSSPEALWSLQLGDFISGSLSWSRPTRMGGLQWRRDFGLQPGLITEPLPQFFGEAALPSSLELYVNGVRQYRGEVLPGPFQVNAVPSVSGAGRAQIVLTDALGRSQILDFGFYNPNRLLRGGLSDYAVEFGAVRQRYGIDSFAYRDTPAASGSLRYGLSDTLTLETHAEAGEQLALAGGGGALGLGLAGIVSAAYARSERDGASGGQTSLGYTWSAHAFTADYSLVRADGTYRDLASLDGRAPPRRSERGLLAYSFGRAGNVSLHYSRLDTVEDGRFRSIGANYSVGLWESASLLLGGARELDERPGTSVFVGLSMTFDRHLSAGLAADRNRDRDSVSASLGRALPIDGGWGWNLRTQQQSRASLYQADAAYRGSRGQISAGLSHLDGNDAAYLGASGGLVWMDRAVFAARRIDDAFALVSTDGIAGVPVLLENRRIGTTDTGGHYLLTGLNAWQPNQVSIEPLHLPPQIQVTRTQIAAIPADRSGVALDFGLREVRSALLILHDAQGQPLPLGSRVHRETHDPDGAQVGYDGQVYLEDLRPHNRLVVDAAQGTCTLGFDYPYEAGGIPVIGPLRCLPEMP